MIAQRKRLFACFAGLVLSFENELGVLGGTLWVVH